MPPKAQECAETTRYVPTMMTRKDIFTYALDSKILDDKHWHWFRFHFEGLRQGITHPFAASILEACYRCEQAMPGYGLRVIDTLAGIGGHNRHRPDYEQLLQVLSELHVVQQVVKHPWPTGATFDPEPKCGQSKKNPELCVTTGDFTLGVEVKAPALFTHEEQRRKNSNQLPARSDIKKLLPGSDTTLPRDNPVKDFLVSANEKFAGFKEANDQFIGVLVIVWDDFIYEPLSSLVHERAGLLTKGSFARDQNGDPLGFPNVDSVVLIRHLHQLRRGSADEPFVDSCTHALDYGDAQTFPWKVAIPTPIGRELPQPVVDCFQTRGLGPELGAEYMPTDVVFWL